MASQQADVLPHPGVPVLPRHALVYTVLACASVMCLLIADIVGIKLFQFQLPFSIFGKTTIEHTCGMLTFPITFLITDWVNDYYGKKAARRIVLISFAMAMGAFGVMQTARAMPHWDVPFNVSAGAFDAVFNSASVMYIASLCAYIVGSFADIFLFGLFKRLTKGKHMWVRATGSTIFSQMIDSFVVTWLAFRVSRQLFPQADGPAAMGMGEVLSTAATGYTLKFLIAVGITPLLYLGSGLIARVTGLRPLPPGSK